MIEVWVYKSYLRNYWLTLWVGDVGPRWIVNSYSFPTLKRWAFEGNTSHIQPIPIHPIYYSHRLTNNKYCSFSKSCLVVRSFNNCSAHHFQKPQASRTFCRDIVILWYQFLGPLWWFWSRRIIPMWWILEGESFLSHSLACKMQCLGLVHSNICISEYLFRFTNDNKWFEDDNTTLLETVCASRTFSLKLSRSTLPQVSLCMDTKQRVKTSCYLVTKDMVALCQMVIGSKLLHTKTVGHLKCWNWKGHRQMIRS